MLTGNKDILPYDIGDLNYPFNIENKLIDSILTKDKEKEEVLPFMYM